MVLGLLLLYHLLPRPRPGLPALLSYKLLCALAIQTVWLTTSAGLSSVAPVAPGRVTPLLNIILTTLALAFNKLNI